MLKFLSVCTFYLLIYIQNVNTHTSIKMYSFSVSIHVYAMGIPVFIVLFLQLL